MIYFTIEFIFDKGDINISPLMNEKGMLEIQKIINKSKTLKILKHPKTTIMRE